MAQAPKLTPDQWDEARDAWEQDSRDGYTWLVKELGLSVSAPGVRKTAAKQGWEKRKAPGQKPSCVEFVDAPGAKPKAKRGGGPKLVSETIETMGETISETIETMVDGVPEDECGANGYAGQEHHADDYEFDGGEEEEASEFTNPGTARVHVWGESIQVRGKYISIYPSIARSMAMLGATDEQMAEAFRVSRSTFLEWKGRHPEFAEEVHKGKLMADAQVAASAFHGAIGYSHPEEVIKVVDDKIVRVNTIKHYPPNATLNVFWLKNRQPELWKEKVEIVEKPSIALVDKDAMEAIYRNALDHAATVQASMIDRGARLGLTIDNELDDD